MLQVFTQIKNFNYIFLENQHNDFVTKLLKTD